MEATDPSDEGRAGHPTVAVRAQRGRDLRKVVARSAHGQWRPAPDRRDPIEPLEEQARSRVPELGPIRYGRMLVSAFTFFRGTAAVMASDLAAAPHIEVADAEHQAPIRARVRPEEREPRGSAPGGVTPSRRIWM